jgi:hypothetical protein
MLLRVILTSILVVLGPEISGQTLKFERAAILGPDIPDFAVPRPPVFADFNRDGQTDLIVGSDKSIWLFLNRGGGQFLPPVVVEDFGPYDAGDLNSDGNPDILLGGTSTKVLFGAGDGTFPRSVDIGPASQTVHIADINGDHRPDLVVRTKDSLLVYLSNGDGTFQTPVETPLTVATYGSIMGDFNGDGVPDVLLPPAAHEILAAGIPYTSLPDRFEILAGKGDGTFRRRSTSLDVYTGPLSGILVADFNGDKISDVAFGDTVALGDGSGDFRPPVVLPYCCLTAAADVNGDGVLDLFAYQPYDSYYGGGFTLVMFGKGDGTFGDAPSAKSITGPVAVAEGEFAILGAAALDGDGFADFVAGRTSDGGSFGGLWALLGSGDGTFHAGQKIGATRSFAAMETADFNGDGKRDLAVADLGGGVVRLYLGRGDGSFDPVRSYDVGAPPFELAWQDFNGDGIHDLAVLTRTGGPTVASIPLLFGAADGFSSEQGSIVLPEPIFMSVLRHADFNGDVKLDLVGAGPDLWVGLGNGDGTFRQVRRPVENAPWISPLLRVAFLDRDSRDDILTVGPGGDNAQELLVFLSNGDGTFRRSPGNSFIGGINGLAAADFTGDGIIDVVVTNYFGMYFLRGRGDGTFGAPAPFVSQANQPDQQQVIASVDFNFDGKRDLFTCGSFCSIRLGNGDGTFQTPQRLDFGQGGYRFLLADFDNDGLPDIAVMESGKVELFLNKSR